MNVNNPKYSKLLAIATRMNTSTTSAELSNCVLDLLNILEGKPFETRVVAYCYTDAALIATLCETAVQFAQDYPDKMSDFSRAIITEWERLQKELGTRPDYLKENSGFSASYLTEFGEEVCKSETLEAFECAMSKVRPYTTDTTSMGAFANKVVEKSLGKLIALRVIPEYLSAFPGDKLTADISNLYHNLDSLLGASTLISDCFMFKDDE